MEYTGDPRPSDVPEANFWRSMDIYSDHMVRRFEQLGFPLERIDSTGFMVGKTGTIYYRAMHAWKGAFLLMMARGGWVNTVHGNLGAHRQPGCALDGPRSVPLLRVAGPWPHPHIRRHTRRCPALRLWRSHRARFGVRGRESGADRRHHQTTEARAQSTRSRSGPHSVSRCRISTPAPRRTNLARPRPDGHGGLWRLRLTKLRLRNPERRHHPALHRAVPDFISRCRPRIHRGIHPTTRAWSPARDRAAKVTGWTTSPHLGGWAAIGSEHGKGFRLLRFAKWPRPSRSHRLRQSNLERPELGRRRNRGQ